MKGVVDYVVIGEATTTHSGLPKPLYFSSLKEEGELPPNVIVYVLELDAMNSSWEREIGSRELLSEYLSRQFPDSFYILSDVDEIPSLEQIQLLLKSNGVFHFLTPTQYRRANWALRDNHRQWSRGVMGLTGISRLPNGGRFSELRTIRSSPGGIHLSYVRNNPEQIFSKLEAFAHTELNQDFLKTKAFLNYCDDYRIDHLGRFDERGSGLLEVTQLENLSEVQLALLSFNPSLFDFEQSKHTFLGRIFASMVTTNVLRFSLFRKAILSAFIAPRIDFNTSAIKWMLFFPIVGRSLFLKVRRRLSVVKREYKTLRDAFL